MAGIERVIRVLEDCELRTCFQTYYLIKDEVKSVRFKNQAALDDLLKFKHFVLAKPGEKEARVVPVILPTVDETTLTRVVPKEAILEDNTAEIKLINPELEDGPIEDDPMDDDLMDKDKLGFSNIELLCDEEDVPEDT